MCKCSIRDSYPVRESSRVPSKTYMLTTDDCSLLSFVKGINGCSANLVSQSSFLIFFSSLSFSPWNPSVHDEAREKMLTQKVST